MKLDHQTLVERLDGKTKECFILAEQNRVLQEAVVNTGVNDYKDSLELDIRIKTFEDEAILSQQERYQLAHDIDKLTRYQNELFSKIKESEEVLNT